MFSHKPQINNNRNQYNFEAPCLILDYRIQHKEIEKPKIVYKRAPTVRDVIAKKSSRTTSH